jgi:hypothetical protein
MALTLTYSGNIIEPVYSNINWVINDSSIIDYFEFLVYPEGFNTKTYRLYQSAANIPLTLNIAGTLQDCFSSYANQTVDSSIIHYNVVLRSYLNGTYSGIGYDSNDLYVYNGVKNYGYDLSTYIISSSETGKKFLNDYSGEHYIHYDSIDNSTKLTLETFNGVLGTKPDASVNLLTIIKYSNSGSIDTSILNISQDSSVRIQKIDISPLTLNIPYNTKYYTAAIENNRSELIKVNIKPRDSRFDKYYRFIWINKNGVTNAFNFDLAYLNSIEIDKDTYIYDGFNKTYNTSVKDKYTVTSGWITEEESLSLKDLWYSPDIKVQTPPLDYNFRSVVIDIKKVNIEKRRNAKLINYTFEFQYAQDYLIQRQ